MVLRGGRIGVYMMASRRNGTLYIGVTTHIPGRVAQHREGNGSAFTRKHDCRRLVWFEEFASMTDAIQREKTMKKWPRQWKVNLIERENPGWDDLYEPLWGQGSSTL